VARIAGVNIPREKRVEIGLTYVFGIGRTTANEILGKVGISKDTYVRDLTEEEVGQLREVIERVYIVERTKTNARTRKGPKRTVGKQRKT
jgi:small subunit ribosomal protein S13